MRLRFIPAGAGNSGLAIAEQHQPTVHPRWRGEQVRVFFPAFTGGGSSPLARGTGRLFIAFRHGPRFIPAGAGNSWALLTCGMPCAVHPRWRGEQAREA